MAYQSLKLRGGANTVETPALNEAGISSSQFVRFKPDPKGNTLVEKLGGWAKFYATKTQSIVRSILGWQDTNANKWIAFGTSTTTIGGTTYSSQLTAIECFTDASGITKASPSIVYNLTPNYLSDNSQVLFQTTINSATVSIIDNIVTGLTPFDSVYISTPVSVGGITLHGQYNITVVNGNQYFISATNILGNPALATYTTVVSALTVTAGTYAEGLPSTLVLTYAVQSATPFIVGENINIAGITPIGWNGSGIVLTCTTTQVTIVAPVNASGVWVSGGSLSNYGVVPVYSVINGSSVVTVTLPGHGQIVGSTYTILNPIKLGGVSLQGNYLVISVQNSYTFTIAGSLAALSTTSSYANAEMVTSGSSTTTAVTLVFGGLSYAQPTFATTGGSSTVSEVTLSWAAATPFVFTVGASIYVAGVAPSSWNGGYIVTVASSTSVTYALAGAALSWVSGGSVQSPMFNLGYQISVSGASPSAWNGVFVVTNSTSNSVTYALSGAAVSWISGGLVSDIGGDVGLVYNISATAIPPGSGWGIGPYGSGGWGVGSSPVVQLSGKSASAKNWSLDNWGEVLLAAPQGFMPIQYQNSFLNYGPIYAWNPTSLLARPTALTNGPIIMNGFFVAMPQRQIISWGSSFNGVVDPLLVRWCDVSNYNVWIGQITNQAGSYRISSGSVIVGALQAQHQGLIWTDVGLWSMQYIGPPYIYSFNQIGQGCGLIGRRAAGVLNGVIYWMGSRQFFTYTANGVENIPCAVWDIIFQELDMANTCNIVCAVNSLFKEITWYYPVINGNGENSAYVRYNFVLNQWDFGLLSRSAWIDNSVLGPPIGYDPGYGYIYQSEISPDADGVAMTPSFTTGWFAIADGENKAFLDEVWADFKWGYENQSQTATLQITFNAADFPGQTPIVYGPFTVTQSTTWFNPRIRARLLSMTISGNDLGSFWRLGNVRYRVIPDGRY